MTRREAEWDDEERANVLSLIEHEGQQCAGCGGYLPETTDPANESRYQTDLPRRCFRCDGIQIRQAQYTDAVRPSALTVWPVRRV